MRTTISEVRRGGEILASRSREWERAVVAAEARLNEGWVLAETRCASPAAEELAAFLSAYGVPSDDPCSNALAGMGLAPSV